MYPIEHKLLYLQLKIILLSCEKNRSNKNVSRETFGKKWIVDTR